MLSNLYVNYVGQLHEDFGKYGVNPKKVIYWNQMSPLIPGCSQDLTLQQKVPTMTEEVWKRQGSQNPLDCMLIQWKFALWFRANHTQDLCNQRHEIGICETLNTAHHQVLHPGCNYTAWRNPHLSMAVFITTCHDMQSSNIAVIQHTTQICLKAVIAKWMHPRTRQPRNMVIFQTWPVPSKCGQTENNQEVDLSRTWASIPPSNQQFIQRDQNRFVGQVELSHFLRVGVLTYNVQNLN